MSKLLLNDENIKQAISTVTKRQELCDTLYPSFYSEIAPGRKYATFYVRVKQPFSSKNRNIKIGRSSELSTASARKQARLIKADWQLARNNEKEKNESSSKMTLSEYVETHYMPFAKSRKRTWRNDKSMLDARILKRFGDRNLESIKYQELQDYLHELKAEGLSNSHADHHVKLIRRIFNLAIKADLISSRKNPAADVELYNAAVTREQFLTDRQIASMVKVLDGHRNRNVADIILLLLASGLRLNEVLTLRWKSCDLDNARLSISAEQSKSKREKKFPINSVAMKVLQGRCRKANPDYIFTNRNTGKAYSTSCLRKPWVDIKALAGIEKDFTVHSLRHTFASLISQNGKSIQALKELLGHADIKTSMIYSHLGDDNLMEVSESVSDRILAATKAGRSASP